MNGHDDPVQFMRSPTEEEIRRASAVWDELHEISDKAAGIPPKMQKEALT